MHKFFLSILVSFVFVNAGSSAIANDRQNIYLATVVSGESLLEVSKKAKDLKQIRNQAVTLANDLKNLSYSESAARVSDKIAPPPGVAIESTNRSLDLMEMQSGNLVEIQDVPVDWFTGYLEKARQNLKLLLDSLDGETIPSRAQIEQQSMATLQAIKYIIQPPNL